MKKCERQLQNKKKTEENTLGFSEEIKIKSREILKIIFGETQDKTFKGFDDDMEINAECFEFRYLLKQISKRKNEISKIGICRNFF